jgi:molybdate transport repressor ModE-like protein
MRWNDRIGRRIKLSDLHILLAVAQNGSMTKAASQLAVSHPVVSRSIGELEHTLGVQLLERNPRGIELTEYGRALLNRSHAAFDELRQGVKDIESLADPTNWRSADRDHAAARRELRLRRHRSACQPLSQDRVSCGGRGRRNAAAKLE